MRKQGKESKYMHHPIAQAWLHWAKKMCLANSLTPCWERGCSSKESPRHRVDFYRYPVEKGTLSLALRKQTTHHILALN